MENEDAAFLDNELLFDDVLDFFVDDVDFPTNVDDNTSNETDNLSELTQEPVFNPHTLSLPSIVSEHSPTSDLSAITTNTYQQNTPATSGLPQIPSNHNWTATRKGKMARKVSDLTNDDGPSEENQMKQMLDAQSELPESKLVKANSGIARPVLLPLGHSYAQMYVNSINSGDLLNAQKFFRTFMAGPGTFVANHRVGPRYGVPEFLSAFSPQLFAHYLLGVFAMFPDLVLKMGDTRTVTQGDKTKVVMDIQVLCTKLYDIPNYSWAPQAAELCSTFQNLAISSGQYKLPDSRVVPEQRGAYAVSPAPSTAHGSYRYATADGGASYGAVSGGAYGTAPSGGYNAAYSAGAASHITAHTPGYGGPYAPNTSNNIHNPNDLSGPYGLAYRGRSCAIAKPTPADMAVLQRLPIAPSNFVTALVEQAEVLPVPIPLHTRGTITLYMDENNCIQHIAIEHNELRKELPTKGGRPK